MRSARRVRPTARGVALGALGLVTAVSGVLLGVRLLVQVGMLPTAAVLFSLGWLVAVPGGRDDSRLRLTRSVVPHPVAVGQRAVVRVDVGRRRGGGRPDRWHVSERAARELSGPLGLRARVLRTPGRIRLTYAIEPVRRGRWPIGPLEVQHRDLFGLAAARGPLGATKLVTVHPAVAELDLADRAAATDVDRAAIGARTPAADDTLLRDYRTGDDLRRVHWRSSARRGELVVRQDERAGRRPAAVLLDIPVQDADAEWSISMATSMALALIRSGHHVRLLGGGTVDDHGRSADGDHTTAEMVLDRAVDLTRPENPGARTTRLLTAIDQAATGSGGAELVFAVVGAVEADALASLGRIGASSRGWALVVAGSADHPGTATGNEQERTVEALRRAGWTACAVRSGADLTASWDLLLTSDERWEMAR